MQLLAIRMPLFQHRTAVRLAHFGDLPVKVTVDWYDRHLLITDYEGIAQGQISKLSGVFIGSLTEIGMEPNCVVGKNRPDNLSRANMTYEVLYGPAPSEYFQVREESLAYDVSFTEGGFGTGIFLDMVKGRRFVNAQAKRCTRVLNLFAYTGAFSIAAAAGGAEEVIEVDTYQKWLKWGQRNQKLNGITNIRQRQEDAVKFLLKQSDNSYDMIICDPPSFARPKKGKPFRIQDGYQTMSSHFHRVLTKGGILVACCNHDKTSAHQFEKWLPKQLSIVDRIKPDIDFPNAHYLKILVLKK